jgi:hypothetical protein
MEQSSYAVGQAVFLRTNTPDCEEDSVAFQNLEELVKICSQPRPGCILEKVIIYAMPNGEPCALTLGFVAATKGQKPDSLASLPTEE